MRRSSGITGRRIARRWIARWRTVALRRGSGITSRRITSRRITGRRLACAVLKTRAESHARGETRGGCAVAPLGHALAQA